MTARRVLVVGAGAAGLGVARELRAKLPDVAVTVVTRDDGHQYPKPQLSASLRTGKQPDQLIAVRAEALAERGIEMVTGVGVTRLDVGTCQAFLEDGRVLAYDDLVLAVGASPIVPPMEGLADVAMTVNHLDDYRRFRERLVPDAPVLVIGGGLIGIEFAADLTSQGHAVHVVDPGPGPLPRLLPPGAAGLLARALADAGVTCHWGRTVKRIDAHETGYRATLSDGTTLAAATVLSAVGLRPDTRLAREAGLPVGRGILVDDRLRAAPRHYALGDCVELPNGVYLPFIKPIGEQARYIARAIAGEAQGAFPLGNYVVIVKVPFWPISSTTPLPNEAGSWHEEVSETGSLSRLVAADGTLLRVVGTGDRSATAREMLDQVPPIMDQPLVQQAG